MRRNRYARSRRRNISRGATRPRAPPLGQRGRPAASSRSATYRDWATSPIDPRPSYSVDAATPTPAGSTRVRASSRTHSPTGPPGQMDRQVGVDEQVAVEVEDPADALPKSADAATSARGDGPWPSTSERAKPNQVRRDVPIGPLSASSAPDARTTMVGGGSARGPAPHGRDRRRTTPLRAPSAAASSRRRNGPRGRPAHRDPAPARPQQRRHHIDLPPRHRQRRDHRDRPRPPRAMVAVSALAPTLTRAGSRSSREAIVSAAVRSPAGFSSGKGAPV